MDKVEAAAHEQFIARAKNFLASDPYWLMVLGRDRSDRKRVANEFAKLMTTIPHIEDQERPNRAVRKAFHKGLPSSVKKATGVKASDLG